METVVHDDLQLKSNKYGGKLTVILEGKSDARNPGAILTPFFESLLTTDVKELVVNFCKLEYMNSSTVPPLVLLLKKLGEMRIKGKFVYDSTLNWQVKTFTIIEKLVAAQRLDNVTVCSEP